MLFEDPTAYTISQKAILLSDKQICMPTGWLPNSEVQRSFVNSIPTDGKRVVSKQQNCQSLPQMHAQLFQYFIFPSQVVPDNYRWVVWFQLNVEACMYNTAHTLVTK